MWLINHFKSLPSALMEWIWRSKYTWLVWIAITVVCLLVVLVFTSHTPAPHSALAGAQATPGPLPWP